MSKLFLPKNTQKLLQKMVQKMLQKMSKKMPAKMLRKFYSKDRPTISNYRVFGLTFLYYDGAKEHFFLSSILFFFSKRRVAAIRGKTQS